MNHNDYDKLLAATDAIGYPDELTELCEAVQHDPHILADALEVAEEMLDELDLSLDDLPLFPLPRRDALRVDEGIEIAFEPYTGEGVILGIEDIKRSILLLGSHGSGKTTLMYWLIRQLICYAERSSI